MPIESTFLACNYSNKKVKDHFGRLKEKLEKELPVKVVLIDKEQRNASRDIWVQIQKEIQNCSLAVFDVSAFRPNVVLELGYALSIKEENEILITFDERKPKTGRAPEWLLSDISHLHRIPYKQLAQMDEKIDENIRNITSVSAIEELYEEAEQETSIPDKYKAAALQIVHKLREKDSLTDRQFEHAIKGNNVNQKQLASLLKKHKLARRDRGRGQWHLA